MSRWFRHYAGMMRDEKLVRAALRAKQPIERVVWIWGAILESAAEINEDGRYDIDASEVAYFLRADEADIRAVFDALAEAGRVAGGAVVKWGSRQFQSDRSAPRQAAYRERIRSAGSDGDDSKTEGDAEVTAALRHGDAPETETETKKKIDDDGDARATPEPLVSPEANRIADEVAKIAGFAEPLDWPPGWCGAPMRVQAWLAQGWTSEPILAAVRGAMARKRDGPPGSIQYFEKPIAGFIARQSAPLPTVVPLPGHTVEIRDGRNEADRGVIAAADRLIERIADFDAGPGVRTGIRGGTSPPAVRAVSKG